MKNSVGALILAIPAVAFAQSALKVDALQFSPPATVAELDMGKLKGEPTRLAWSEDGKQFYLQTTENAGRPNAKTRHYVFASDGKREDVGAEPAWASAYWVAKSGQAPPDNPALKIQVKSEQRQQRTTSVPMGGEMARGGAGDPNSMGTSAGDAAAAAYGAQTVTVHSMVLKGETIGEFVNAVIVPGRTFGWGPKGSKAIAYTTPKDGEIVVMDFDGKRKPVAGTKEAVLPAWSPDGSRLAWLQKAGRRDYLLKVADVSSS
jgi:hypothetical protein